MAAMAHLGPARRARLKLLAAVTVPVWGRAVLVIVGATLLANLADNAIGATVAVVVGLLLWHTGATDWWRMARLTAGSLAQAVTSSRPAAYRDRLVNRVLALRTATVEAVATAQRAGTFAPAWIFLGAAEDLTRATRAGFDVSRMAAAVAALQERLHQPQLSDATDPRGSSVAGDGVPPGGPA